MRPKAALLLLAVSAVSAVAPTRARAWTEANVQSIAAHVVVDDTGKANVSLLLTVRIGGGWLEGLDIDGLDPDLVLDEDAPPWARSATDPALTWTPAVRVRDDGRVRLSFRRRGSPRRGTLLVGLSYATDLANGGTTPIEDGRVQISWTLPGWRAGVDGVEVTLETPPGAEVSPSMQDGPEAADEHVALERDGTAAHTFSRIHLPRTVPWTVSVHVPAEVLAPELRGPSVVAPRAQSNDAPDEPAGDHSALVLMLFVVFTTLLSRASFTAAARRRGVTARPFVPGPLWLLVPGAAGVTVLAAGYSASEPLVSLVSMAALSILAVQRAPIRAQRGGVTSRPARARDVAATRRTRRLARVIGSPLLDMTTAFGLSSLLALSCSAIVVGGLDMRPTALGVACVGLLVIPFVAATRLHLPRSPADKLASLLSFALARTDLARVALRPVLGFDERGGGPVEARLRLTPAAIPPGLLRFDVVIVERPVLGGFEERAALLLVTEVDSPAETRVAEAIAGAPVDGPDRRRARLIVLGGALGRVPDETINALVARLGEPADHAPRLLAAA